MGIILIVPIVVGYESEAQNLAVRELLEGNIPFMCPLDLNVISLLDRDQLVAVKTAYLDAIVEMISKRVIDGMWFVNSKKVPNMIPAAMVRIDVVARQNRIPIFYHTEPDPNRPFTIADKGIEIVDGIAFRD